MTTFKRYLLSSAVTFFTSFVIVVVPQLGTVSYTQAALFSLIVVGIRAGFKALGEAMVSQTGDRAPMVQVPLDLEG
jgi:hypothetical protein